MLKALIKLACIALVISNGNRLQAQNFNYLDSDQELEIELADDVNFENDLISNLVILMDYDIYNRNYRAMLRGLDRLAGIYSPDSLALLKRELELFESHHPFLQLCENKKSGKEKYDAWQPFKSRQFEQYFSEQIALFKKYEFLSCNDNIIAGKIYKNSTYYLTNHAYKQARFLLNWLEKEYPNTYYVQRRFVANRLKNIELEIGKELPVASFTTVDGNVINISNRRSTPLLIAYLDIFSTDYKTELGTILEVGKRVQDIQMIVLLSSDMLEKEISTLSSPSRSKPGLVIANDVLKGKLGLSDYSSNLLISSENKILAKDMSFHNLSEIVAFLYNSSGILARK